MLTSSFVSQRGSKAKQSVAMSAPAIAAETRRPAVFE
jgi:hypothetical protein